MSPLEVQLALDAHVPLSDAGGESDWLLAIGRGDVTALGRAYDEHHAAVRSFCRRLLGDEAVAEDLVQDVFVALPKAMRRFRGDCSLRTFLVSMAVHHSRHHLRAAMRRRVAMAKLALVSSPNDADPEHLVRRSELANALLSAMDAIPHEQRVVFVLSDVEERSSPEVAAIVGVPEATVRTRLFHARRKLRALIEQKGVTS